MSFFIPNCGRALSEQRLESFMSSRTQLGVLYTSEHMGSVTSTRSLRSVARILEESQGHDVHFEFEDEDGDLRTVHIFNRDQQTVDRTNGSAFHDEEDESDDDVEVIAEGEGRLLNTSSQSSGGGGQKDDDEEEEGEVETDSDTEEERDAVSHISTLRMLARLFGGRTAVP